MPKTKNELEIARLTDLLARRHDEQRRDKELHDLVVKHFENQMSALREDRRRLTQTVEALARRCDQAESYDKAQAPTR